MTDEFKVKPTLLDKEAGKNHLRKDNPAVSMQQSKMRGVSRSRNSVVNTTDNWQRNDNKLFLKHPGVMPGGSAARMHPRNILDVNQMTEEFEL